ncbi:MAG: hypothetical protein IV085_12585 [Thiobacillus sp.]|nr:hypothetical protein [Thiobacillus sp.]
MKKEAEHATDPAAVDGGRLPRRRGLYPDTGQRLAASRNQAWVARAVLALVGLGFGWTALVETGQEASPAMQALIFLAAFGLVHVPAAIILLLKTWQRSGSAGR